MNPPPHANSSGVANRGERVRIAATLERTACWRKPRESNSFRTVGEFLPRPAAANEDLQACDEELLEGKTWSPVNNRSSLRNDF